MHTAIELDVVRVLAEATLTAGDLRTARRDHPGGVSMVAASTLVQEALSLLSAPTFLIAGNEDILRLALPRGAYAAEGCAWR